MLRPQHHYCGQILQIYPLQHPQELVIPHKGHNTTLGPSASHLLPGLLQLPYHIKKACPLYSNGATLEDIHYKAEQRYLKRNGINGGMTRY